MCQQWMYHYCMMCIPAIYVCQCCVDLCQYTAHIIVYSVKCVPTWHVHVSVLVAYVQVWGLNVCCYWECYVWCIGNTVHVLVFDMCVGIWRAVGMEEGVGIGVLALGSVGFGSICWYWDVAGIGDVALRCVCWNQECMYTWYRHQECAHILC